MQELIQKIQRHGKIDYSERKAKRHNSGPSLKNRIVLYCVDPQHIFAQWDFDKETRKMLGRERKIEGIIELSSDGFEYKRLVYFYLNNDDTRKHHFHKLPLNKEYTARLKVPCLNITLESKIKSLYKPEGKVYNLDKEFKQD